jgi:type II secretory ATPase GspE/PulE/Tfp pilus assembly ATPase PilB-like protein
MRIEPYLVSSSLVCSIAQRLVRRICRHCLAPEPAIPDNIRQEMAAALKLPPAEVRAFKGTGCIECNSRGYRGRLAIYEFFVVSEEIADLIGPGVRTGQLREAARRYGWSPLREQGWTKVQNGLTPIDEQQRMTRQIGSSMLAPVR